MSGSLSEGHILSGANPFEVPRTMHLPIMPVPSSRDFPSSLDSELFSVHVRFASTQGRRLRRPGLGICREDQALWAERPVLMKRADGTYHLIGTTARLDALARWILSHGAAATVTGPERLRRQVAEEARRILRQYGPTRAGSSGD